MKVLNLVVILESLMILIIDGLIAFLFFTVDITLLKVIVGLFLLASIYATIEYFYKLNKMRQ